MFIYILFFCITLIFIFLTWKKINYGIYIIIFLLPSYLIRFQIFGFPATYLECLLWILFFIFVIQKIYHEKKNIYDIVLSAYRAPIIFLFISGIISIFISPDPLHGTGLFRAYILEPIIFYFIFINTIQTKNSFKKILWSLFFLGMWIGSIGVVQIFTGWGIPPSYASEIPRRITSIFPYPNAVSLLLAPIFILLASVMIQTKLKFFTKKTIWLGFLFLLVTGGAIIFSFSEGAWIGIAVALFVLALTTPHRWKILFTFALLFFLILIIPESRQYVVKLITFQDVSGDVRLALWQGTWNMFCSRPIFGAGLSGFPRIYALYKLNKHVELLQYPHNIIFNFWSELGLIGLLSFIWIFFIFFKQGLHLLLSRIQGSRCAICLIIVMVGIIIHGLVDVPYFKNDLAFLFWTIAGMMELQNKLKLSF